MGERLAVRPCGASGCGATARRRGAAAPVGVRVVVERGSILVQVARRVRAAPTAGPKADQRGASAAAGMPHRGRGRTVKDSSSRSSLQIPPGAVRRACRGEKVATSPRRVGAAADTATRTVSEHHHAVEDPIGHGFSAERPAPVKAVTEANRRSGSRTRQARVIGGWRQSATSGRHPIAYAHLRTNLRPSRPPESAYERANTWRGISFRCPGSLSPAYTKCRS